MVTIRNENRADNRPRVKLSTIVQGAVNCCLIPDTTSSRREFSDWAQRDPSAAVVAIAGYRKIRRHRAAATRRVRVRAADPAPAVPTDYPDYWKTGVPNSSGGLRTAEGHKKYGIVKSYVPDTPYPSSFLVTREDVIGAMASHGVRPNPRIVHAANTTAALAEQLRNAAQTVAARAQASSAGHYDPHSLIAAAGANAARLADARAAVLQRRAQDQATRGLR